jgi:hypothetical protein
MTWRNRPVSDWRAALEDRMGHNRQKNANHRTNHANGFDRNAGTYNEGKAPLYDMRKIEANRAKRTIQSLRDAGGTAVGPVS